MFHRQEMDVALAMKVENPKDVAVCKCAAKKRLVNNCLRSKILAQLPQLRNTARHLDGKLTIARLQHVDSEIACAMNVAGTTDSYKLQQAKALVENNRVLPGSAKAEQLRSFRLPFR